MKLDDYIKGNRRGRQAHETELDAMRDPFLGDALDGFDAVPDDHSAALERLAEGIRRSAADGRAAGRVRTEQLRERRVRSWSIAAAAVFIVGVIGGGAWLLRDGLPHDTSRGTFAGESTSSGGYLSGEEIAILPPVTVIKEETPRRDTTRTESRDLIALAEITPVPNHPAEATDIENVQLDETEIAATADPAAPAIRVRGTATLSSDLVPLYIVDGVVMDGITDIDPTTIANIELLKDTDATAVYGSRAAGGVIVVTTRDPANPAAKARAVEGRVVDASTGEALAGVFVREGTDDAKGEAQAGTLTDADGRFALPRVNEGAKIVAQYLGYEKADVDVTTAADGKEVLIAMVEDSSELNDVVVVGYGTQRKSMVTGSVSAVKESRRHRAKAVASTTVPASVPSPAAVPPSVPVTITTPATSTAADTVGHSIARPAADTVVTVEFGRFVAAGHTQSLQGTRVTVSFEVGADGRPHHIKVVDSPSPAAARTARKMLRKGPDWPTEPSRKLITINL